MTKVATIDTRRFFALLLIAAMLIAMIPIGVAVFPYSVLADNETFVGGDFEVNDGDFFIGSVEIWTTGGSPSLETSIAPHLEYHVKVDVTDTNGMNTLDNVTVVLFYETDGEIVTDNAMGSDDSQTQATFEWMSGGDFAVVGPTGTWDCEPAGGIGSVVPTLAGQTGGVFEFHITVGDVATQTGTTSRWFAYAYASDPFSDGYEFGSALTMQWYGAIAATGTTPSWTAAAPDAAYRQQSVLVTYISNGGYNKFARASSPWTRTPAGTDATLTDSDSPGANGFALKADDQDGDPDVAHRLISSYRPIGTGSQTEEIGDDDASGLWLKLGTPFVQGTYSGTVYFGISNS
jgi:hypothetical protein